MRLTDANAQFCNQYLLSNKTYLQITLSQPAASLHQEPKEYGVCSVYARDLFRPVANLYPALINHYPSFPMFIPTTFCFR